LSHRKGDRETLGVTLPTCGRSFMAIEFACPSCRSPLSPVAVPCINCGHNPTTGTKIATVSETEDDAPRPKRPPSRFQKSLVSRLANWKLWSGLEAMVTAAVWFFLVTRTDTQSGESSAVP
jgi:hypothetical protein